MTGNAKLYLPRTLATRIAAQFKDSKLRRRAVDVVRGVAHIATPITPTCAMVSAAVSTRKKQRGM